eukprot:TRINITY_DN936_c0_g1_i4.p1 TRINITY_DN936_c0_g1~~TRINITY_DN936_c0_g1_i4.p1  ORF type:complete len:656 (+),score=123.12 TRINITY_DN936_c0_g1_i4:114-2081(+)
MRWQCASMVLLLVLNICKKKKQIMDNWETDKHTIAYIRDSLITHDELTEKMVSILEEFDQRIDKTLQVTTELYNQTRNWKSTATNLEQSEKQIAKVLSMYEGEYELVINGSLDSNKLKKYLKAVDAVANAYEFLSKHPHYYDQSFKVQQLKELNKVARKNLLNYYSSQLTKFSEVVELDEYIYEETEEVPNSVLFGLKYTDNLMEVIKRFSDMKEKKYLDTFIRSRTYYLMTSIATSFGIENHDIVTHIHLENLEEEGIENENDKSVYKNERGDTYNQILEIISSSVFFIRFLQVSLMMINSEKKLVKKILPKRKFEDSFYQIIEPLTRLIIDIGNRLIDYNKSPVDSDNTVYFGNIQILLDVYAERPSLLVRSRKCLEFSNEPKYRIPGVSKWFDTLERCISSMLSSCAREVYSNTLKPLPEFGYVHSFTSHTLLHLSHIADYKRLIQDLIPDGKSLEEYMYGVVVRLQENLTEKARKSKYSDGLAGIFLLNNFYFIQQEIKNGPLIEELGNALGDIESWVEAAKYEYFACWNETLDYLNIEGKKEQSRLDHFNNHFRSKFERQQYYSIYNHELKMGMIQSLHNLLLVPYENFLEKAQKTSKKPLEIKYPPSTLADLCESFFKGKDKQASQANKFTNTAKKFTKKVVPNPFRLL